MTFTNKDLYSIVHNIYKGQLNLMYKLVTKQQDIKRHCGKIICACAFTLAVETKLYQYLF